MAEERLIPNRPTPDESKIPAADKDLIVYTVAFGAPNQKAFALWHPEFLDSAGKLSKAGRAACTQFFNYSKNREYADSYTSYLKAFLGKRERGAKSETSGEIDDARRDKARIALYNKVLRLIEGDDDLDPDTLKIAVDMAKKLSIVADEVEVEEEPRRYLPVLCGECVYCSCIESYVKTGQIENVCLRCKALDIAKEQGFHYDPTKLLNIDNNETNNQNNENENMEY